MHFAIRPRRRIRESRADLAATNRSLKQGISRRKTVDKHRQHLMAKLDINDLSGLTRYAIGAGIIENSVQVTIV
jgi:hypothetical protein